MSKSNIAGYDIEKNPVAPSLLLEWEGGDVTVYVPHITAVENGYQLSWTNDAGLENPETITITNGRDGIDGTNGVDGTDGAPGTTFTPTVTSVTGGYQLSWSNNGGLPNPQTVTIYNGDADDGVTFTPTVTQVTGGYQISWTNNGGLPNPQTVTIYNGINGDDGDDGANGITFTPTIGQITGGYQLSWTNDGGAQNPPTVNIMNGTNGVSPTVTVSRVSGGVEISVTDGSGTSSEVLHDGAQGSRGVTFTPTITETANGYQLSWSNDGELINPPTVQITNGASGQAGNDGITYTPTVQSISGGYQLSWTNDGGAQNPPTVNIMNGTTPSITATASADNLSSSTPTVTVTKTGTDAAPNFDFAFSGLKGAQGIQGETGPQGIQGVQGATGPAGPGVPAGGTAGQILKKSSATDYATEWAPSPYIKGYDWYNESTPTYLTRITTLASQPSSDGSGPTTLNVQGYQPNEEENTMSFDVGAVPPGGTTGQMLVKSDDFDNYTVWADVPRVKGMKFAPDGTMTGPANVTNLNLTEFTDGMSSTQLSFVCENNVSFMAGTVPPGGTAGQVLAKDNSTNYKTKWINPPGAFPSGNLYGYANQSSPASSGNYKKFTWSGTAPSVLTGVYLIMVEFSSVKCACMLINGQMYSLASAISASTSYPITNGLTFYSPTSASTFITLAINNGASELCVNVPATVGTAYVYAYKIS